MAFDIHFWVGYNIIIWNLVNPCDCRRGVYTGDTLVYFAPRINYVCLLATYYYVFTVLTKGIVFLGVGCKLRSYYFIHEYLYLLQYTEQGLIQVTITYL